MPLLTQKTFSSSTFHHLLIPNKVKTAWPSSQDKAAENLHLCLHLCAYQLSFWMISNSLVSSCQSRSSVCTGFDIQFQQLQIFCIYLVLFLLLKAIDNFFDCTLLELTMEMETLLYKWGILQGLCHSPQTSQCIFHWNLGTWDFRFCSTFVF